MSAGLFPGSVKKLIFRTADIRTGFDPEKQFLYSFFRSGNQRSRRAVLRALPARPEQCLSLIELDLYSSISR